MKSILGFCSFGLSVSRSVAVVSLIDPQQAKKFVDFAIGLMIFALNLPDRQVLFFWENSNHRRIVINPANQKGFWG